MDPITLLLFFTQAAKLANTIAEALQTGEMSPEEAEAQWKKVSATWSGSAAMWRATPAPLNKEEVHS